ncbi:Lipase 1 [Lasiodiplodia theobromae]|uniref:Lipase 1 n=1 Tax=Lasiodiplodia theobromae TaxID=45133 RepID=UPI0015C3145B|nr:Lipase 1 [Lasiodiplodia theobromae]KAF4545316.1 Lipase 1 [Lasiodiplodia theobromae]
MLFGAIGIRAVAFAALAPVALADEPNLLPVVDPGYELYRAVQYNKAGDDYTFSNIRRMNNGTLCPPCPPCPQARTTWFGGNLAGLLKHSSNNSNNTPTKSIISTRGIIFITLIYCLAAFGFLLAENSTANAGGLHNQHLAPALETIAHPPRRRRRRRRRRRQRPNHTADHRIIHQPLLPRPRRLPHLPRPPDDEPARPALGGGFVPPKLETEEEQFVGVGYLKAAFGSDGEEEGKEKGGGGGNDTGLVDLVADEICPPVYNGSNALDAYIREQAALLLSREVLIDCNAYAALNDAFASAKDADDELSYAYLFDVPPASHGRDLPYTFYVPGQIG